MGMEENGSNHMLQTGVVIESYACDNICSNNDRCNMESHKAQYVVFSFSIHQNSVLNFVLFADVINVIICDPNKSSLVKLSKDVFAVLFVCS
jgi:hypothetical protein